MARICQVSVWSLYTQGQQIKVYSQIYRLCQEKEYVINPPAEPEVLPYTGATVFPPQPGIYAWVIPFDFASLYPTTIIAYNIDYSTFIPEERLAGYTPDQYHEIEWAEHTACPHDPEKYTPATRPTYTFCGKRRYCFLREPKGVLPELLESLLRARKETKKQLAGLDASRALMRDVLDKRQLAYKVSANSMYGAMGVTRGYLPFMPGAMCTTAMGRKNIEKAAAFVQSEYGAQLIYGDTDSIYVHFPGIHDAKTLWEHACRVEGNLLSLFPRPMKLAFEEKIYKQFLILTKKRYMALTCDDSGSIDKKLTIRGVLLARRDNCSWARKFYERIVRSLMDGRTEQEILQEVADEVLAIFHRRVPVSHLVITKLVGSDYVVAPLPSDPKKRAKRIQDLNLHHLSEANVPEQCGCGQKNGCRFGAARSNTKSTGFTDDYAWIAPIEDLFTRVFGSTQIVARFSNLTRLNSSEYLSLIRNATVSEWITYTAKHFYHDTDTQPVGAHYNVGLLETILEQTRRRQRQ